MRRLPPCSILAIACIVLAACESKSKDGSSAAAAADPNTVVIDEVGLSLGGERIGNAPEDKLTKSEVLFQKLKERREQWKQAHPQDKFPGKLTLELGPNVTCLAAMALFQTAGFAGYPHMTLKQGTTTIEVPFAVPAPPFPDDTKMNHVSRHAFVWVQADGNVELKPGKCGGAYDVVPAASLPATVKEWCGDQGDCPDELRVRCDAGMPMSKVLPVIDSVQKVSAKTTLGPTAECKPGEGVATDRRFSLQLLGVIPFGDEPAAPPAPALPAGKKAPGILIREGKVTATGGLTSDEVLEVMKPRLADIKTCFEAGVMQNPNLQGRVTVRLEIGKKGAVMSVGDGGSDLPDRKAVECVLAAASMVTFPAKGSRGEVIYPIMMSPK